MKLLTLAWLLTCALLPSAALAADDDPTAIVRSAIAHWRGLSSYSEMTMTIHRPDWERSMTLRAWTAGDDRSLVRVIEPARDRGNATLTDDNRMWTYSPRVNRVIKVPSSLMGQSWMGSDFSNKDISRADDIVDQYRHTLVSKEYIRDEVIWQIEAMPLEDAPVVWGREMLKIRDDFIVLSHHFYDQDGVLVKRMESLEIGEMGGRVAAIRQRMTKEEAPEEWTEIELLDVDYDIELPPGLFTRSSLQNPRD